jgi:hypothetical protein
MPLNEDLLEVLFIHLILEPLNFHLVSDLGYKNETPAIQCPSRYEVFLCCRCLDLCELMAKVS